VADSTTPPIVLKESQKRTSRGLTTISFPAGLYVPDFQTKEGVYYRAPSKIISRALGMNQVLRGGIFIPFGAEEYYRNGEPKEKAYQPAKEAHPARPSNTQEPALPDYRHAAWFDHQEGSGGLLGHALTSPKNLYRLNAPIIYDVQTK